MLRIEGIIRIIRSIRRIRMNLRHGNRPRKWARTVLAEVHALEAELIKWMFLFWAGTALAGLLLRG